MGFLRALSIPTLLAFLDPLCTAWLDYGADMDTKITHAFPAIALD